MEETKRLINEWITQFFTELLKEGNGRAVLADIRFALTNSKFPEEKKITADDIHDGLVATFGGEEYTFTQVFRGVNEKTGQVYLERTAKETAKLLNSEGAKIQ